MLLLSWFSKANCCCTGGGLWVVPCHQVQTEVTVWIFQLQNLKSRGLNLDMQNFCTFGSYRYNPALLLFCVDPPPPEILGKIKIHTIKRKHLLLIEQHKKHNLQIGITLLFCIFIEFKTILIVLEKYCKYIQCSTTAPYATITHVSSSEKKNMLNAENKHDSKQKKICYLERNWHRVK